MASGIKSGLSDNPDNSWNYVEFGSLPVIQATGVIYRAQSSLLSFNNLERSQFIRRDVAAHEVARLCLGERRLLRLADAARQPARAPGVEDASAGRIGGAGNLAGENDPLRASSLKGWHRRQQRLGVGMMRSGEDGLGVAVLHQPA